MIKWYDRNMTAAQTVNKGMSYCFLSSNNEQCFPFFYCKEFLIDAVHAVVNETNCSVFGFDYDPKLDPVVDLEQTRILLKNDFGKIKVKRFINSFEEMIGFNVSSLKKINKCYLFEGDKKWLSAPPLLSLLTMLLRAGAYSDCNFVNFCKNIDKQNFLNNQDEKYLRLSWKTIEKLINKQQLFSENIKDNYPKETQGFILHEYSGIVSYSTNVSKRYFPEWYKGNSDV